MKKILLTLTCCLCLILTLSSCGDKYTYIEDNTIPTDDELLVEFYPYKESVYKQLEDEIINLDKMEETDFKVIDYETKEWEMSLRMNKDVFKLHKDRLIKIKAQKNNIIFNDYAEVIVQLNAEEKVADDIYSTILAKNDFTFPIDINSPSTYYTFTVDGKLNPTKEDYNNKNNNFYLYIHLGGEKTSKQSACSDEYFKKIEKSVEELLQKDNFKDIKKITVSVYISGCGELKYTLINGTPITKILRTQDGEEKNQKILDAGKTDFEKMTPEEREKFLEEHEDIIQESIKKSQEQMLYEEPIYVIE